MIKFKYDTHVHTSEASRCAISSGADVARFYSEIGYDGFCVTDHFFNGNTCIREDLPWEERIELFCRGYENARAEGAKYGLRVFFGWEYSFNGTDFLTLGLDKSWLLGHPRLLSLNLADYCSLVREDGGYIIHAHPFREAGYIEYIRLSPGSVDAVETINTGRSDEVNARAAWYAGSYNLAKTAGSDLHSVKQKKLGGIYTKSPPDSVHSLIKKIKTGETGLFVTELP